MAHYPLRIKVDGYFGGYQKKVDEFENKRRNAHMIEDHINSIMEKSNEKKLIFDYQYLASTLNIKYSLLEDLLVKNDGESNEITITKE